MKKLIALFLAMLMVFTLAGCNNNQEEPSVNSAEANVSGSSVVGEAPDPYATPEVSDSPVIASYALIAANQDGVQMEEGQFPVIQIALREDGTGTYGVEGSLMDISWVLEGKQYTFVSPQVGPENPLVLTVDGDRLVAMDSNLEMIFQKQ